MVPSFRSNSTYIISYFNKIVKTRKQKTYVYSFKRDVQPCGEHLYHIVEKSKDARTKKHRLFWRCFTALAETVRFELTSPVWANAFRAVQTSSQFVPERHFWTRKIADFAVILSDFWQSARKLRENCGKRCLGSVPKTGQLTERTE